MSPPPLDPSAVGSADADATDQAADVRPTGLVSLVIVNKDERMLADTLDAVEGDLGGLLGDVVVVDASRGALDDIRVAHPWVTWIDYEQPPMTSITIAHQRNLGVRRSRGDVVVFTDSGCLPVAGWLESLVGPILAGEETVVCGPAASIGRSIYTARTFEGPGPHYVSSATTINIAFRRGAFDEVGGFDESFGAAEDLDFTWRLSDHGHRLRWVNEAVVSHDWGSPERQLRRAFFYGKGWARLFRKHPHRLVSSTRENPVPVIYGLYLLGLPLTLKWRWYPLLLLIPAWRVRHNEMPLLALGDHLCMGAGVLYELLRPGT